jgi:hypothetical protein
MIRVHIATRTVPAYCQYKCNMTRVIPGRDAAFSPVSNPEPKSPRPLTGVTVQPEAYKLTEEQTAKWEKQWRTEVGACRGQKC